MTSSAVIPPRIFLSPPHLGGREMEYVREAFSSNYIAPLGPMVDAFEHEFSAYTGIAYCLALDSGTAGNMAVYGTLTLGNTAAPTAGQLILNGSTSGAFIQTVPAAVASYSITWPAAQGARKR